MADIKQTTVALQLLSLLVDELAPQKETEKKDEYENRIGGLTKELKVLILKSETEDDIGFEISRFLRHEGKVLKSAFRKLIPPEKDETRSANAATASKYEQQDYDFIQHETLPHRMAEVLKFPNPKEDVRNDKRLHKIDKDVHNLVLLIKELFDDKKKGQRAELLGELREKFKALLEEQDIPKDIQDNLTVRFMVATNEALKQHEKRIPLPEKPPKMWQSGQGKTAIEFLQEVYKPWLEARVMTYIWLDKHDPNLRNTLRAAVARLKDKNDILLPLTETEKINNESQELIELLGQEVVDKIYRTKNTNYKRASREREKDSLDV